MDRSVILLSILGSLWIFGVLIPVFFPAQEDGHPIWVVILQTTSHFQPVAQLPIEEAGLRQKTVGNSTNTNQHTNYKHNAPEQKSVHRFISSARKVAFPNRYNLHYQQDIAKKKEPSRVIPGLFDLSVDGHALSQPNFSLTETKAHNRGKKDGIVVNEVRVRKPMDSNRDTQNIVAVDSLSENSRIRRLRAIDGRHAFFRNERDSKTPRSDKPDISQDASFSSDARLKDRSVTYRLLRNREKHPLFYHYRTDIDQFVKRRADKLVDDRHPTSAGPAPTLRHRRSNSGSAVNAEPYVSRTRHSVVTPAESSGKQGNAYYKLRFLARRTAGVATSTHGRLEYGQEAERDSENHAPESDVIVDVMAGHRLVNRAVRERIGMDMANLQTKTFLHKLARLRTKLPGVSNGGR